MKTKEVTEILKGLGWQAYTDEVGDKYTHFRLPDRTAQIIYGVRKFRDDEQLEAMLSLTTEAYSEAGATIGADRGSYTPLIRAWNGLKVRAPEIMEEHVRQISDEAIVWAKDQDLVAGIEANAKLPTDAPGSRPIWHLAALAVSGDVGKLKSYQASFESGDRLGFVPYVTKDYIDRAVAFAEEHSAKA